MSHKITLFRFPTSTIVEPIPSDKFVDNNYLQVQLVGLEPCHADWMANSGSTFNIWYSGSGITEPTELEFVNVSDNRNSLKISYKARDGEITDIPLDNSSSVTIGAMGGELSIVPGYLTINGEYRGGKVSYVYDAHCPLGDSFIPSDDSIFIDHMSEWMSNPQQQIAPITCSVASTDFVTPLDDSGLLWQVSTNDTVSNRTFKLTLKANGEDIRELSVTQNAYLGIILKSFEITGGYYPTDITVDSMDISETKVAEVSGDSKTVLDFKLQPNSDYANITMDISDSVAYPSLGMSSNDLHGKVFQCKFKADDEVEVTDMTSKSVSCYGLCYVVYHQCLQGDSGNTVNVWENDGYLQTQILAIKNNISNLTPNDTVLFIPYVYETMVDITYSSIGLDNLQGLPNEEITEEAMYDGIESTPTTALTYLSIDSFEDEGNVAVDDELNNRLDNSDNLTFYRERDNVPLQDLIVRFKSIPQSNKRLIDLYEQPFKVGSKHAARIILSENDQLTITTDSSISDNYIYYKLSLVDVSATCDISIQSLANSDMSTKLIQITITSDDTTDPTI